MTRKHYQKIAGILAAERAVAIHHGDEPSRIRIAAITFSIADVMAQDNPRFDRAKFYRAAGMDA